MWAFYWPGWARVCERWSEPFEVEDVLSGEVVIENEVEHGW